MVQQQQQKPTRKAARRTVMEWIVLIFNLIPALLLTPVFQSLVTHHKTLTLITMGFLLGTVGFWGASISLLGRARKVAAVFEFLASLGWWCATVWLFQNIQTSQDPRSWVFLSVLFLIGLFLTWLASWLWRFQDDTEEAR